MGPPKWVPSAQSHHEMHVKRGDYSIEDHYSDNQVVQLELFWLYLQQYRRKIIARGFEAYLRGLLIVARERQMQ